MPCFNLHDNRVQGSEPLMCPQLKQNERKMRKVLLLLHCRKKSCLDKIENVANTGVCNTWKFEITSAEKFSKFMESNLQLFVNETAKDTKYIKIVHKS